MNINGSSSEWINVWTHFVLEYFITQYLKGFTAQYSTVGVQFLHDHDYLDISLLSLSSNNITREMDCRHNFQFTRCQVKLQSVCPLVFIDHFYAGYGQYFYVDVMVIV